MMNSATSVTPSMELSSPENKYSGAFSIGTKDETTVRNSPKYSLEKLLKKAVSLVDKCDYELARSFYTKALELSPKNVDILDALGDICCQMGDFSASYDFLKKSIELQPNVNPTKYLNMAQIVEGTDAEMYGTQAIEILKQELEQEWLSDSGRRRDREEVADRTSLSLIHKTICGAYCSLSELYVTDMCYHEEAEEKAEGYLEKAMEYDVGGPEITQAYGNLRLIQNRSEEAAGFMLETYNRLSKCDCDMLPSLEFRIFTGKLLSETSQFDAAADIFEGVMLEDDTDPELWYLVAKCYIQCEDYATAVEFLTKCDEMMTKTKNESVDEFDLDDQLLEVRSLCQECLELNNA